MADVSLELNGMLMMWKIQHVKQDDTEFIRKIDPAFIPVTELKCSYGNIFLPAYRDPGRKNRHLENPNQPALSYEHIDNFTDNFRDLKVRRDLENGPARSPELM